MTVYTILDMQILDMSVKDLDCNWKIVPSPKDSFYKWQKGKGKTITPYTGPSTDYTTLSEHGTYMYTDATYHESKDMTELISDWIMPSYAQCLTFWYHMYGSDVNSLSVYQNIKGNDLNQIWNISSNQGNRWHNAKVDLGHTAESFQLIFRATTGLGGKGDIAIDDIMVTNTICKVSEYDCDFEEDCNWISIGKGNYDWQTNKGKTDTTFTGPGFDHTTGSSKGYYLYLEAKDIEKGTTANFSSPSITIKTDTCFSFWYHMYGRGIGSLAVYIDNVLRWSKQGNQKNDWKKADIDLQAKQNISILFEGTRGSSDIGDIAIDDIVFTTGTCSGLLTDIHSCAKLPEQVKPRMCSDTYIVSHNFTFYPKIVGCEKEQEELKRQFRDNCWDSDKGQCESVLQMSRQRYPECFPLNNITVNYDCQEVKMNKATHSDSTNYSVVIVSAAGSGILMICASLLLLFMCRRKIPAKREDQVYGNSGNNDRNQAHAFSSVLYNAVQQNSEIISYGDKYKALDTKYQNVNSINNPITLNDSGKAQNNLDPNAKDKNIMSASAELYKEGNSGGNSSSTTYITLDPQVTGFNRSDDKNHYDIAQEPDKTDTMGSNDPYLMSKDGLYDTSSSIARKENDTYVYSHSVEGVYDTTSHTKQTIDDENYDHVTPGITEKT